MSSSKAPVYLSYLQSPHTPPQSVRQYNLENLRLSPSQFVLLKPAISSSCTHNQQASQRKRQRAVLESSYRTSSLDRGNREYCIDWRADLFKASDAIVSETTPRDTQELWKYVYKYNDESMTTDAPEQSRGRGRGVGGVRGGRLRTSILTVRMQTDSNSFRETVTNATSATKRPSPTDKDFRSEVLEPCGITIQHSSSPLPHLHFKLDRIPNERRRASFFKQERGALHTSVWLEADVTFVEEVMHEYKCMVYGHMVEAEFASFAKETLFRRDRRMQPDEFSSENRGWKTERKIELVAKPDGLLWVAPPLLYPHPYAKAYEFDIRPDCAYWLSLQGFNSEYSSEVAEIVYVHGQCITSSYLSIEFKKNDTAADSSINQIAAAASLALFNRVRLRQDRVTKTNKQWSGDHVKILRHYGIIMGGANYSIWCLTPKMEAPDWQWAGCTMTRVKTGDCTTKAGVLTLIEWINEIHCWGLTKHARSCERDVKLIMQANVKRIRTSDIYRKEEDSDV